MALLTKHFQFWSLAVPVIVMILLQVGCIKDKRDISQKEFVNTLKGEWYVNYCRISYPDPIEINFHIESQSVTYFNNEAGYQVYYLTNSILCTLEEIEQIQYWSITETNGNLALETKDLCGVIKNYKIEYENYYRTASSDNILHMNGIKADIRLVSPNSVITLSDFGYSSDYGYTNLEGFGFTILEGFYQKDYTLYHR